MIQYSAWWTYDAQTLTQNAHKAKLQIEHTRTAHTFTDIFNSFAPTHTRTKNLIVPAALPFQAIQECTERA